MRNEALDAYVLHHKPYQEKRAIYYLFSRQHGIVHGIGKKGIPQFVPLQLFATGKKSLKTLQQIQSTGFVTPLTGMQQYAALYLNEVLLHLLAVEDGQSTLYACYEKTLTALRQPLNNIELRLLLRHYEQVLFAELGFAIELYQDAQGNDINPTQYYRFVPEVGFEYCYQVQNEKNTTQRSPKDHNTKNSELLTVRSSMLSQQGKTYSLNSHQMINTAVITGEGIKRMQLGISEQSLEYWSWVHRQLIDYLFDYQPLQSRRLWQQFSRYHKTEKWNKY